MYIQSILYTMFYYITDSDHGFVSLIFLLLCVKERLKQIQVQLGHPTRKLMKEVDTWWNSTFHMLERMHGERETVSAAMASL